MHDCVFMLTATPTLVNLSVVVCVFRNSYVKLWAPVIGLSTSSCACIGPREPASGIDARRMGLPDRT